MKAFRRRVVTALAIVSFALLFVSLWAWARTGRVGDQHLWTQQGPEGAAWRHQVRAFSSRAGRLEWSWESYLVRGVTGRPLPWTRQYKALPGGQEPMINLIPRIRLFGLRVYWTGDGRNLRHFKIIIPYWQLSSFFAVLPLITGVRAARRRIARAKVGLCANCGYDLRASRDRCPECNTAIPPAGGVVTS